jgi:1-deoxy-D-xylulose-5-phosphate reductoisomerase
VAAGPLTFEPVRADVFRALGAGIAAGRAGGTAPAVFNAANEVAVALFLAGAIRFGDIPRAIESALAQHGGAASGSREAILQADALARRHVQELFRC